VGSIESPWLLVRHGKRLGWVFGAFVGRIADRREESVRIEAVRRLTWPPSFYRLRRGESDSCEVIAKGERAIRAASPVTKGATAELVVMNLNDDDVIDPICVLTSGTRQAVCPFLSKDRKYVPAGCIERTAEEVAEGQPHVPAISAKDANADGALDLVVGTDPPLVALYQNGAFVVPGTESVAAPDAGEKSAGEKGAGEKGASEKGASETRAASEGRSEGCKCSASSTASDLDKAWPLLVVGVLAFWRLRRGSRGGTPR
jgi:MYXO-CTERM domain-containing protein